MEKWPANDADDASQRVGTVSIHGSVRSVHFKKLNAKCPLALPARRPFLAPAFKLA